MATIGSGNPKLYAELSASQVGASGTKRTVRVTMRCRVDGNTNPNYASSFGYAADYRVVANGNGTWALGSWQTLKGTEWWSSTNSLRTFTQDITFDVGTTSSKSVKVGFDVDSKISNDWDGSAHIDFTVGSTNTAPTMNGSVTIRDTNSSGAVLTGIIPENVSTLYLSWPAGSDKEQGASGLKYGVNQIVNGGGASTVVYPTTNLYAAINIGTGNEGEKRKYYVDCRDNSDVLSTNRANSVEVTKNIFTTDTLNSINSISYDSENITFTYSGAKNSNGNTTFTRVLSCDGLTVYNPTLANSPATVSIWRSGTVPSGAYIKFDDIKEKLKNSTYTGTLNFTLRTTNAYGTAKSSSKVVNVDLRTKPNPATNQEISTTASESTIYKKVAFANNYYFLPDGSGVARVKWSAGSGKLGETISYELYVAYGSGSWQKLADLSSGTLYYNHVITKQTISQQFKYMIRTKTSYGYYEDAVTPAQTLHYYNAPSISVKPVIRTETTAEIPLTVKTSSSIPNIGTVGTWSGQGSGNLTAAQTEQKINVTGLTGAGTYTITIVYNDNTGFSSNQTRAVAIGANLPIMFLNKYGLGVGGVKADVDTALTVSGNVSINGNTLINNNKVYHEGNKPTLSEIGAAASNHTHSYLPLSGGAMTGNIDISNGTDYRHLKVERKVGSNTYSAIMAIEGGQGCAYLAGKNETTGVADLLKVGNGEATFNDRRISLTDTITVDYMLRQNVPINKTLMKNGVKIELFGRNKENMSQVEWLVNGTQGTAWNLGATCYMSVEIVKTGGWLVMTNTIVCDLREEHGWRRYDGITRVREEAELNSFVFNCINGNGHGIENALIKTTYF